MLCVEQELETELSRVEEDSRVGLAMKAQLDLLHQHQAENRKLKEENAYHRSVNTTHV